jgi:hypothetical protein
VPIPLPPDYHPFRELNLCSNVLVNVPVPILVGGRPGLLVGQQLGLMVINLPLVWIAAPTSPGSTDWVFAVENNRPLRPLIVVEYDQPGGTVQIRVEDTLVLRAKQTSQDTAVVDALDLRPLGLVAYGDEKAINVGGTMMERNRFERIEVAFKIGTEQANA